MENSNESQREVGESYLSSLIDLTETSKPMITMLSMLADENIQNGQTIVDVIEQRIFVVEPPFKLPILYLIDCIVKKRRSIYIDLFGQRIVRMFVDAFKNADMDTRKKLYELRKTWNVTFPAEQLYKLDVELRSIDPKWPMSTIEMKPQMVRHELTDIQKLELEIAAKEKEIEVMGAGPSHAYTVTDPASASFGGSNARKRNIENEDASESSEDESHELFGVPQKRRCQEKWALSPEWNQIIQPKTSMQKIPSNIIESVPLVPQEPAEEANIESKEPAVDVFDLYQKLMAVGCLNNINTEAKTETEESNLNGDISTDDNTVDLPIKHEDELSTLPVLSINTTNKRIPILDDDNDVFILPEENPLIIEISDDEGESELMTSDEDVQILEPNVPMINLDEYEETNLLSNTNDESQHLPVIEIKDEPKYDGYEDDADDEDDCFLEVGTLESDILFEDSLSPIETQTTLITTLDDKTDREKQQLVTLGTNKIKINISKDVQLNRVRIDSTGSKSNQSESTSDSENSMEMKYEVKEPLKHVQFNQRPVVKRGVETSNLCSIM
jgi:hypothetical protein